MALIGFVTPFYLFPENRPQENIDVRLFNNIVTGRSVTVTVVEQSILYYVYTFVYILYSNVCVQFCIVVMQFYAMSRLRVYNYVHKPEMFIFADRGDLQYVEQSFFVPDNGQLTFTVNATMSVQPMYIDDSVGNEDPESLDLVIQAVTDPSLIRFTQDVANLNIFDDEGMKLSQN